MGSNRIVTGYRNARRGVRRARRSYRAFRTRVQEALRGNLGLRLTVYAVLLLVAAGSLLRMADVNASVRARPDMKWFMRPNAVQVAAPPLDQERFEQPTATAEPEEAEEDAAPAEGDNLAAGILSIFAPARAEELPGGEGAAQAAADAGIDPAEAQAAPDVPDEAELPDEPGISDAPDIPDEADVPDEADDADDPDLPDGPDALQDDEEAGFAAVPLPGEDTAEQAGGFVIWDEGESAEEEPVETAAPAAKDEVVELTISAAGDCTLGGDVRTGGHTRFDRAVKKKGYAYFLSGVKSAFAKDDLTIVNLEGPLTSRRKARVAKMYTFRGKPAYAKILQEGSVEVCNIANNHALDFDTAGLKETVKVLNKAGIGSCGFGKVYFKKVKGVKVGFMGFTKWQYSAKDIYRAVKAQRKKCDLLIVSIHWGEEGVYKASRQQRIMGRAAILGGADLVLGHHPHVFGGIEKYKGKYIVYSLGNFCFGGNRNPSDKRTYIFQQTFRISAKGVKDGGINILPCAVTLSRRGNDYRPAPMPKQRALLLLKNIAKVSYTNLSKVKWMDGAYPVKAGLVKRKK